MRVELSSIVIGGHVDLCLVDETDKLNIVRGLDDLDTLENTVGNETGTMATLGAPGNFLTFGVTDG